MSSRSPRPLKQGAWIKSPSTRDGSSPATRSRGSQPSVLMEKPATRSIDRRTSKRRVKPLTRTDYDELTDPAMKTKGSSTSHTRPRKKRVDELTWWEQQLRKLAGIFSRVSARGRHHRWGPACMDCVILCTVAAAISPGCPGYVQLRGMEK